MKEVKIGTTEKGFPEATFKDYYDRDCSIQLSSLLGEPCIWFGIKENQMHLNMEQVKELLPLLEKFSKTGFFHLE